MKQNSNDPNFPPFPPPFFMPFYYASLSSLLVFYRVDAKILEPYLKGTGLKPAIFGDQGAVTLELQNYTGHSGQILETCNEIEFDILAYPVSREPNIPEMSLKEFVTAGDQTKNIGAFRVYVPCDNPFAIKAGKEIFGEPKFQTTFGFNVPSLNNPGVTTWTYSCFDPSYTQPEAGSKKKPAPQDVIYKLEADLNSMHAVPSNASPITLYSMLPGGELVGDKGNSGRLIGSRWEIHGLFDAYFPNKKTQRDVNLTIGKSSHPMRKDMEKILGKSPHAAAVRVYQSVPAAAENRAFYIDIE
ncbi:MAG: acetoacetate decarboxylase family protein [Acidobacteria bacterium]|nr:acetoacetate decarboxylase family protein [Acidobacteriota bacterium]MBK9706474.1 acetoacetate decarboxylase family protein [Acidobacteriota bacterium]